MTILALENSANNLDCVILAAGKNVRLDNGHPKCLTIVDGQSLLERNISIFSKLGVKRFCVVIGFRGEMIRDHCEYLQNYYSAKITCIENHRYELSNGYSLHSSKNWIHDNRIDEFFFVMSDHYFEKGFVEEFIQQKKLAQDEMLKLAVDIPSELNQHIDLEDVTKVQVNGNKIKAIGKEVSDYKYYDTGLFHVKSEVFDVLDQNFKYNKESISDLVQKIAETDGSVVCEITGYYWNDVDTPEDLANTMNAREKV